MKMLAATDGSRPALHAVKYAIQRVGQLSSASNSVTPISVHDDVDLRHAQTFVGKETIAALIVGFMVARMGWGFGSDALHDLIARSVDEQEVEATDRDHPTAAP